MSIFKEGVLEHTPYPICNSSIEKHSLAGGCFPCVYVRDDTNVTHRGKVWRPNDMRTGIELTRAFLTCYWPALSVARPEEESLGTKTGVRRISMASCSDTAMPTLEQVGIYEWRGEINTQSQIQQTPSHEQGR